MEMRSGTVQGRAVEAATAQISDDLSAWRRASRLTQAELARRSGVSARTISKIESGDLSISTTSLLRILHTLGQLAAITDALDPNRSELGVALLRRELPKRVRHG